MTFFLAACSVICAVFAITDVYHADSPTSLRYVAAMIELVAAALFAIAARL